MNRLIVVNEGGQHFLLLRIPAQAMCCPQWNAGQSRLRFASKKTLYPHYAVICLSCQHAGRLSKNPDRAVKEWNKADSVNVFGRIANWVGL